MDIGLVVLLIFILFLALLLAWNLFLERPRIKNLPDSEGESFSMYQDERILNPKNYDLIVSAACHEQFRITDLEGRVRNARIVEPPLGWEGSRYIVNLCSTSSELVIWAKHPIEKVDLVVQVVVPRDRKRSDVKYIRGVPMKGFRTWWVELKIVLLFIFALWLVFFIFK